MPAVRHSPAYVMRWRGAWRIVVPIRGRLNPQVLAHEFATKAAASDWLQSLEGQRTVDDERTQIRPVRAISPARSVGESWAPC